MIWLKGLLINFQFFTSIPVPFTLPMDREHLEKAIKTFPLLGLVQGGTYACILFTLTEWTMFSSLTVAIALWLAGIIFTGGIHLDGWMDASDAFFSYRDQEKRLEIMSDPRSGAFAVLSVIVLLSTRFFLIYEIVLMHEQLTYILVALIPILSKMVMGVLLLTLPSAKKEGLGTLFKDAATDRTLLVYPIYLVLFIAATSGFISDETLIGICVMILATFLIIIYLKKKTISWFGGMTGDVVGASVEGTEQLLWMTLWLLHYFAMG